MPATRRNHHDWNSVNSIGCVCVRVQVYSDPWHRQFQCFHQKIYTNNSKISLKNVKKSVHSMNNFAWVFALSHTANVLLLWSCPQFTFLFCYCSSSYAVSSHSDLKHIAITINTLLTFCSGSWKIEEERWKNRAYKIKHESIRTKKCELDFEIHGEIV